MPFFSATPGFTRAGGANEQRISKKRPFFGTVLAMESLCIVQSANDKDTIRVEIDLGDSGLQYDPGDALGIHASNAPEVSHPYACFQVRSPTLVCKQ